MRVVVVALLVVAVLIVASQRRATADAAPGMTGELGAGGSAVGDISKSGGETDVIGVDLVQGCKVDVKWSAGFAATVDVLDPNGSETAIGLDNPRSATVLGWQVPTTGHWRFLVRSSDETQGGYRLTVTPKWAKSIKIAGTDATTFDVPMPADGFVRGVVRAAKNASSPRILSFRAPDGAELLPAPVDGTARVAKWTGVATTAPGVHVLTATAGGTSRAFTGTLTRRVPKTPPTHLDLRNFLDSVSYEKDGVADYFRHSCGPCHGFASSYSQTRGYAKTALSTMRSGVMPLVGPRASPATIELVSQWIRTGYQR
jgi:hypothetical protein